MSPAAQIYCMADLVKFFLLLNFFFFSILFIKADLIHNTILQKAPLIPYHKFQESFC